MIGHAASQYLRLHEQTGNLGSFSHEGKIPGFMVILEVFQEAGSPIAQEDPGLPDQLTSSYKLELPQESAASKDRQLAWQSGGCL